jgi:hypothetical protein
MDLAVELHEPTVRDLRHHIADGLEMSDSAELLELLVANKILDVNLKLRVFIRSCGRAILCILWSLAIIMLRPPRLLALPWWHCWPIEGQGHRPCYPLAQDEGIEQLMYKEYGVTRNVTEGRGVYLLRRFIEHIVFRRF